MPDNSPINDPFKPQQPRIPGVSKRAAEEKPSAPPPWSPIAERLRKLQEQMPPKWIMLSVAGALLLGAGVAWWSHGTSAKGNEPAEPPAVPAAAPAPAKPTEKLPVGPGEIATLDQLENVWASRKFIFHDRGTSRDVPAMVVHLPGETYWAFSLREPYGNCELEFVTDLAKLRSEYSYRAEHPMVGDPCNKSVFDLTRYGSSPGGLVRGEIAQGAAVRPPMAIEIRIQGRRIIAVRME
jgi:hypothetical protein